MNASQSPPAAAKRGAVSQPQLLFFYERTSGSSPRAEGFLAQVLQRRRNHDTFRLHRIDYSERPDLARRCGIEEAPALVVVGNKRLQARIERPAGCAEIRKALAPWLR
jgi:hypothetical protein